VWISRIKRKNNLKKGRWPYHHRVGPEETQYQIFSELSAVSANAPECTYMIAMMREEALKKYMSARALYIYYYAGHYYLFIYVQLVKKGQV